MPTVPRADLPKGLPAGRPVVPLVLRGERAGGVAVFGSLRVRGDAYDRISLRLDGAGDQPEIAFGGGASPSDVKLYRGAASVLESDSHIRLLAPNATTPKAFVALVQGDTQNRAELGIDAAGAPRLLFGAGGATAPDVKLYRSAANVLQTDDTFVVGGGGTIVFGSLGDTNLYRSAANVLKTDDTFNSVLGYQFNGTAVVGSRKTGWGAPTGTATRTTFATSTVTTAQLAERVKALIDDLTTHGLIGA